MTGELFSLFDWLTVTLMECLNKPLSVMTVNE